MAFSFFRSSGREARPAPGAATPPLTELAWTLHQRVDAAYAELGPFATVMAKRVLDGVAAVLRQSGGQSHLQIRAQVTLERMLMDYLPTTLRTYARARHDPSARAEVEQQLEHLAGAVEETLVAVRDENLQELQVQGDFLDTKFTGSDLTL